MEVCDLPRVAHPPKVALRSSTKDNGARSAMTYGISPMQELFVVNLAIMMPFGHYLVLPNFLPAKDPFSLTTLAVLEVKVGCQTVPIEAGM